MKVVLRSNPSRIKHFLFLSLYKKLRNVVAYFSTISYHTALSDNIKWAIFAPTSQVRSSAMLVLQSIGN
jgi:hypothetical protein